MGSFRRALAPLMPRLLLHTCCAPCLTQCLEVLSGRDSWERVLPAPPDFELSILFDNPNIAPESEFNLRREHLLRLLEGFRRDTGRTVELIADTSARRRAAWEEGAAPFASTPERGARCGFCYEFRLREAFAIARSLGFDAVATTLTLSPHKATGLINEIGASLGGSGGPAWLKTDFKKNEGYKKSIALSERYGLYRQDWCGCRYSRR